MTLSVLLEKSQSVVLPVAIKETGVYFPNQQRSITHFLHSRVTVSC